MIMKRLAALILAAPLVGCGPSFPTIDSAALSEAVAQVRGHTVKICSYFPTNETVVNILTTNDVLETAYNIAKQICDAVTEQVPPLEPAQMGQGKLGEKNECPMVRGVCIEGRFLKPEAQAAPAPAAPPNGTPQ
jgi:hypothetical protein